MNRAAWPGLGAAVVAAFLPLSSWQPTLPLAWMVLVLGAAVTAWRGSLDLDRAFDRVEWAALFLLAVMAISAVFGLAPQRSVLLSVPVLAALLIWALLARMSLGDADARCLALGAMLALLLQLAIVGMQIVHQPTAVPADWLRASTTPWLVVPNDIAWFACVLPLVTAGGRWRRLLLLVLFLGVCVLLRSRTAAIAAVFGCAVQVALQRHWRIPTAFWITAAVLAIVGLPLLVWGVPSFASRWQLWSAAGQVFLAHPLLGVGPHNFLLGATPWLAAADLVDPRLPPWPHNLLLEIAAEMGLAGLAAVVWLGYAVIANVRASTGCLAHRVNSAAAAGLATLCVVGLVDASLLRVWLWTIVPLLAAQALRSGADDEPVGRENTMGVGDGSFDTEQ